MNDFAWLIAMSRDVSMARRAFCEWHGRYLDTAGVCPTCRSEDAKIVAACVQKERARLSVIEEECMERAEMYGL